MLFRSVSPDQPAIQYVEACRALLDALTALQPHVDAFVLIGPQASTCAPQAACRGYEPFTTDADLALDPSRLATLPLLADAMLDAGFEYSGEPGIWNRRMPRPASRATSPSPSTSSCRRTSQRRPAAEALASPVITATPQRERASAWREQIGRAHV